MRIDISLRLPRDAKTVALVRSVAMAAFDRIGVTDECIEETRLALSEACSNVIQHADTEDDYEVRLEVEDGMCSISVVDSGAPIDPFTLKPEMPDPSSPNGRGVALMTALVDSVKFVSEPEAGMVVHLVKALALKPDGALARLRRDAAPA